VREAARHSADHLAPLTGRDWSVQAGDLEWNARQTLDHVVDALGFYALTLATRAQDDRLTFETARSWNGERSRRRHRPSCWQGCKPWRPSWQTSSALPHRPSEPDIPVGRSIRPVLLRWQ
jgi:hypothetical protein